MTNVLRFRLARLVGLVCAFALVTDARSEEDGNAVLLNGKRVCRDLDGLSASADRPCDLRYDIVAKGPGKLKVTFERHVADPTDAGDRRSRIIPVYGVGMNFALSGKTKTCTAEHTVPAGARDALVLEGENIVISSVKVTPLERKEAPCLLRTADGKSVTDLAGWEKRREEIKSFFLNEIYGRRPVERPARLSFAAAEPDKVMMDGKAVRKRVRVSYGDRCGDSSFVVTAFVPTAATKETPAPAFLLICNRDPKKNLDPERQVKSGFWPAEQIVDRGYAAIAFFNGDVTTDASWDFTNGVFGVFRRAEERTAEDWGILSAWAWGASRVMDWIETEPTLDAKHVGVVGHSRGGKTALLAGVTDERFAMSCVNDSGCGGAKLNHWNLPLSEHYCQINGINCWFCGNFRKHVGREQEADFDAHGWLSLMAPRLLAVASATEDAWAGQEGEFQAVRLASPAWELYGKQGLVGAAYLEADKPLQEGSVSYHMRRGRHDLTPYDWDCYMDFADRNGWRQVARSVVPELRAAGVTVNGANETDYERKTFADGEAIRYRLPSGKRHVTGEATEWILPDDARVWFQAEWLNTIHYEALFTNATVWALAVGQRMSFPVTAKLPDGSYRLLTEANVVDYTDSCAVYLGKGRFGIGYYADTNGFDQVGADTTPWRVMLKAKDLQTLATSDIVRRLCPEPTREIASKCAAFVRPGRSVWQWLPAGDPVYGEQKDWYDRTKALGFEYYLVDDGWKNWRDGKMDQWACLKKWIGYGKSIGVESFMWVDSKEMLTPEARRAYLAKVKASGAVGIKIDFIPKPSCEQMKWYEETLAETLEFELMTDFHGCVKPSGREKTWPHEVAREAIRGHEWHITRYNRVLPPEHDCILPFNRLVQGHADYTPMVFEKKELVGYTWARELAQGIVFSAPFLCCGDYPKGYLDNPAAELIKSMPSVYDEVRVLPGSEIGECVALAKRKGGVWYVAVENGRRPRKLEFPLGFLGEKRYVLHGFGDAPDRPDAYAEVRREVVSSDLLSLEIRPCGGYVAIIR